MSSAIHKHSNLSTNNQKWRAPAWLAIGALAASFWVVRKKTRQAEQDNPPDGNFVEVDGVQLHYFDRGEGPALLLLHGNGVTAKDFDLSGLSGEAATRYRVIAFDRPGYGYSERPRGRIWTPVAQARLLHKALQKIGVERPIVLGHSWGTLVALAMALEFPTYVRGLVLLSGYYYPSLRLDVPWLSAPAIPVLGDLMRYTISPLLGRLMWPAFTKRVFKPSAVPERFDELSAWMMLRPSQLLASSGESALMIPAAMMLRKRYAELSMPVTIIAGQDDRMVSADHNSVRLCSEVRHGDLRVQPGTGHMVHYTATDAILAAIDSLDKSVGRPQPAGATGIADGAGRPVPANP